VACDFTVPELLPTHGRPDVSINYGKAPTELDNAAFRGKYWQVADNRLLFQIPGVACYYIANGDSIIVEPCKSADSQDIGLYLMGTAFGALLFQRGILPLHGSAIAVNGRCVVFTGQRGAGKSTVAAFLRQNGYHLLTDDVAAISFDPKGVPWVQPGYPQQKLWPESLQSLGLATEGFSKVSPKIDKYAIPANDAFLLQALPLAAVYELVAADCSDVMKKSLSGLEQIEVLLINTYRNAMLDGLGLRISNFQQCTAVCRQTTISRLIRPHNTFTVRKIASLLELDWKSWLTEEKPEEEWLGK
jgi:hypothetical protein